MQHARGIAPEHTERKDGDLRAVAWRNGPFTMRRGRPRCDRRDVARRVGTP